MRVDYQQQADSQQIHIVLRLRANPNTVRTDVPQDSIANLFFKPETSETGKHSYSWPVVEKPAYTLLETLTDEDFGDYIDYGVNEKTDMQFAPMYYLSLANYILEATTHIRDTILSDKDNSSLSQITKGVEVIALAAVGSILFTVVNLVELVVKEFFALFILFPALMTTMAIEELIGPDKLESDVDHTVSRKIAMLLQISIAGNNRSALQVLTPITHSAGMLSHREMCSVGCYNDEASFGFISNHLSRPPQEV